MADQDDNTIHADDTTEHRAAIQSLAESMANELTQLTSALAIAMAIVVETPPKQEV